MSKLSIQIKSIALRELRLWVMVIVLVVLWVASGILFGGTP